MNKFTLGIAILGILSLVACGDTNQSVPPSNTPEAAKNSPSDKKTSDDSEGADAKSRFDHLVLSDDLIKSMTPGAVSATCVVANGNDALCMAMTYVGPLSRSFVEAKIKADCDAVVESGTRVEFRLNTRCNPSVSFVGCSITKPEVETFEVLADGRKRIYQGSAVFSCDPTKHTPASKAWERMCNVNRF